MSGKIRFKRGVLTEELVALTGDPITAMVMRQMLYWVVRVSDFDEFVTEERKRNPDAEVELSDGWIFKSADQLADELMGIASGKTIRRRLQDCVEKGWLHERNNPQKGWDRTLQYRPDLIRIEHDLRRIGYTLATVMGEEYLLVESIFSERRHAFTNGHGVEWSGHRVESNGHGVESNGRSVDAIPESTVETTPENRAESEQLPLIPGVTATHTNGSSEKDTTLSHAAITAYRSVFNLTPAKDQRDLIIETVDDLDVWKRVITMWAGNPKWNAMNIGNMLDRYITMTEQDEEPDEMRAPSGKYRFSQMTQEEIEAIPQVEVDEMSALDRANYYRAKKGEWYRAARRE